MKVTIGNPGICCVCVTSFKRWLTHFICWFCQWRQSYVLVGVFHRVCCFPAELVISLESWWRPHGVGPGQPVGGEVPQTAGGQPTLSAGQGAAIPQSKWLGSAWAWWSVSCHLFFNFWPIMGSGDSSVVRAPDSWLKGCGFESWQERRENFLLQGQLSDSYLRICSTPVLPQ